MYEHESFNPKKEKQSHHNSDHNERKNTHHKENENEVHNEYNEQVRKEDQKENRKEIIKVNNGKVNNNPPKIIPNKVPQNFPKPSSIPLPLPISIPVPIVVNETVMENPRINKEKNELTNSNDNDIITNETHNYVDNNNVFGFWNLRLIDMFNNKYFNINWTHYEKIAKRDFNITDDEFTWDVVDQRLDDYMIYPDTNNINKTTIHEFNKLKKKYYNWINVLNDDGKFCWDIKLSDIDNDKDFQKIWDWENIRNKAKVLTGQNGSLIDWELVEQKIYNYIKDKSVYYYNNNFTNDQPTEDFIDDVITIKAKYRDYIFLMNNNFYFEDIGSDKEFQETINWTKVEQKIRILLNVSNEEDLNMTRVDLKIKEYEFNSKNFTKKETIIIKDLIKVERQYSDYLNQKNGIVSNKNSTSDGLMSDIGNNIHQGTSMSIILSLYNSYKYRISRRRICDEECLDSCEKNYLKNKNKKTLFSCVAIVCLCDEREYGNNNKFNLTNENFVYQSVSSNSLYFYFTICFIFGLIVLVLFYESNKNGEFFNTFSQDNMNNMENFLKINENKKRVEKGYDYILLNDQQLEI